MKVIDQGVIFAGRPRTDAASCLFPSISVLESGRWLATWRIAPAKSARTGRICLAWSDDEGKNWSEPDILALPAEQQGRSGTWRMLSLTPLRGPEVLATLCWEDLSNPMQPFYNQTTEGVVDLRCYVARSRDGGRTFTNLRLVDVGRFINGLPTLCGPVLLLENNRWAVPFEVSKTYHDSSLWRHCTALAVSDDEGRSWPQLLTIQSNADGSIYYWDGRVSIINDHLILVCFWTYDRAGSRYLPIHVCRSKDGGCTWDDPASLEMPGQPGPPVLLKDGRIGLVYVDRTARPRICWRLSTDAGRTFPPGTELTIHERPIPSQLLGRHDMRQTWDEIWQYSVGLPNAVALPDGGALVVFYTGDHQDATDIAWARLA